MDEQPSYYLRFRGRVQGPYGWDQLRNMVQRGKLTRLHEVSEDGQRWQRAGEVEGLLSGEKPVASSVPTAQTAETDTTGESEEPDSELVLEELSEAAAGSAEEPAVEQWHYVTEGTQQGPVTRDAMVSMIATGQLGARDYVWCPGMMDWAPVSQTEFASLSATPEPMRPAATQQGAAGRQDAVSGTEHSGKALTGMILSLVGILVFGLILGLLGVIFSGVALSGMNKSGNKEGKGMAVTGLVVGILDMIGWALLIGSWSQGV